jgi:hypothetical protein
MSSQDHFSIQCSPGIFCLLTTYLCTRKHIHYKCRSILTLSFISSLLSLAMAFFSIFLIHSLVTPKYFPTSSSVLHVPSLRPYLCASICFSFGFNSSKTNRSPSFNFVLFIELCPSTYLSGIIS